MSTPLVLVICAVIGYLLGSIETAIFVSKFKYRDDVRTHGSGNSGSTNMLRVYGIKAGLITFLGDFIKGAGSVLIGFALALLFNADKQNCGAVAGLFAVIGHIFPLYFGFKGGKGAATILSVGFMLFPYVGVAAVILAFTVIFITRYVSLAVMITMTAFAAYVAIAAGTKTILLVCILIMWVLLMVRHIDNIKRLIKGKENKVSLKKKSKV